MQSSNIYHINIYLFVYNSMFSCVCLKNAEKYFAKEVEEIIVVIEEVVPVVKEVIHIVEDIICVVDDASSVISSHS